MPDQVRILILGFGEEGASSLNWLQSEACLERLKNASISISDKKAVADLPNTVENLTGQDFLDFSSFDIIVKSPGISPYLPEIQNFVANGGELTSNTALFFEYLETLPDDRQPITIGVSGTKGKSTTVAAIAAVLKQAEQELIIAGNQNQPLLSSIAQLKTHQKPLVLMELSSHQLQDLQKSPQIAVVQAIHADHLDYYPSFEEYVLAKSSLTRFQTEKDYCYFYSDNEHADKIAHFSGGKVIPFGSTQDRAYQTDEGILLDNQLFLPSDQLQVKGAHNRINLLPAILIGEQFGIGTDKIKQSLTQLEPLPHRLEYIYTGQGTFINDSLSTTPETTLAALATVTAELRPNQKIILILGGHERNQNFSELVKQLPTFPIEKLYLLPDTGHRLAEQLQNQNFKINTVATLENVFDDLKTNPDSVVLLSPASASYNQFKDYAERGETFKKLVDRIG